MGGAGGRRLLGDGWPGDLDRWPRGLDRWPNGFGVRGGCKSFAAWWLGGEGRGWLRGGQGFCVRGAGGGARCAGAHGFFTSSVGVTGVTRLHDTKGFACSTCIERSRGCLGIMDALRVGVAEGGRVLRERVGRGESSRKVWGILGRVVGCSGIGVAGILGGCEGLQSRVCGAVGVGVVNKYLDIKILKFKLGASFLG